ncbi:MAG: class I SAM-dependent methyltransferase [Solirubrobacterales bacterium]
MRLLYLLWLNVPPARPLADKAMTRVFDAAAQQWDTYNTDPGRLDPLYAAIDRLDAAPQRALDMGCGNGTVPIWLAERYPGAWTFGIDVSPATIEEATRRAAAAGSASRFTVAHNQNCGFDDEELELVTLVNLPPPFAEIARVLATGGHVVVVFTQGPATWFYSAPARLKRGFEKAGLATLEHGGRGRGEFFIAAKR